jgi:hypothetical protein
LVTPIARARPAKVSALADFFVAKLWRFAYGHPFTDLGSSIALELDGDHAVLDGEIVGVPKPSTTRFGSKKQWFALSMWRWVQSGDAME